MQIDQSTLEMALVGYQAELKKIEEAIATIRRQLGGRAARLPAAEGASPRKRTLSAAARRRIAAAQRKRWSAFHASQKADPRRKAGPKRNLSTAARTKLAANLAKARAAKATKTQSRRAAP